MQLASSSSCSLFFSVPANAITTLSNMVQKPLKLSQNVANHALSIVNLSHVSGDKLRVYLAKIKYHTLIIHGICR
eukprot:g5260.t1